VGELMDRGMKFCTAYLHMPEQDGIHI